MLQTITDETEFYLLVSIIIWCLDSCLTFKIILLFIPV